MMTALANFLAGCGSTGPIRLHPDNSRYFLYRGKPTVLVTSAEHYGAVLNSAFDYRAYLEVLRADGLNHTRLFSGAYREVHGSFGITDNTLAPEPSRYACPWKRTATPGAADGLGKFDLDGLDPAYLSRLKDFMATARKNGVVVEFNLFCPHYDQSLWDVSPMKASNNVNGTEECPREEVYTLKHPRLTALQEALTRNLVKELNGFDNLYFEVMNEPYAGTVTAEWQDRIVKAIVETEEKLPNRHLISLNVANHRAKVENPNPAVSIFNFHYCVPPDVVEMNYGLKRVIGENETGFRGKADVIYRTEGWEFILAGGGLYSSLDYSFTTPHPRGDFAGYSSPGGGSPALRRQMRILKDFIHGFGFVRMAPDPKVVSEALPAGLATRSLSEPGKAWAFYLHFPPGKEGEVKFDIAPREGPGAGGRTAGARLSLDLPPGNYRVEWVDTLTGKAVRKESLRHGGGVVTLASPPFAADIALGIRTR